MHPDFLADLRYWVETDRKLAIRLLDLVIATLREPFTGIGKPEPMKYDFRGLWSRRLTEEHRIIYRVEGDTLHLLAARGHYPKKR